MTRLPASRPAITLLAALLLLVAAGCDRPAGNGAGGTGGTGGADAGNGGQPTSTSPPPPPPTGYDGGPSWRMAGQNLHNTRHQPAETVIGPDNVGQLVVKWEAEVEGSVYATPAVEGGYVYVPDSDGYLYKLDAATGDVVWKQEVRELVDRKGDVVRATPFVTEDALIFGTQANAILKQVLDLDQKAYVVAVSKDTGELTWKKNVQKVRAPRVTQSAVVHDGSVFVGVASGEENFSLIDPLYDCCTHRGKFLALDAGSGEILHELYTIPDVDGLSGGSVWGSTAVIDEARNQVYVTTGNNYSVPDSMESCLQGCIDGNCTQEEVRACVDQVPGNHFDSILALDLGTLQIKWSYQAIPYDAWSDPCVLGEALKNCPEPEGVDHDFGQGPALFTTKSGRQLVGAAQKSGQYHALDPDTGEVVWTTQVGPGGLQGGSEWGSATDGERVYVAISNSGLSDWTYQGNGPFAGFTFGRGFWSALDADTGEILWQTPEEKQATLPLKGPKGPVTVANGVVYGTTTTKSDHDLFALDAATGAILWRFSTGKTANSGAAVVDGVVYWGSVASKKKEDESDSSYASGKKLASGEGSLYAFCVAGTDGCPSGEGS